MHSKILLIGTVFTFSFVINAGETGFVEWQIWDGLSEAASFSYDLIFAEIPIIMVCIQSIPFHF
jgi:hypothetical protein